MRLSIVIPVYNECHTIAEIYSRVQAVDLDKEIILVDDGSTDGTQDILRNLTGSSTHLFRHEQNRGKGAALRTAFSHATGDIVIIQDADLEYDPRNYGKLIQPILEEKAEVVYGSRFIAGNRHRAPLSWHIIGNRLLTQLSNILADMNLSDMETGHKAFRRDVLERITIEENRFGCEPEITAKVAGLNARILEVEITYESRTYREGKKVDWKDGFSALRCIVKYNLLRWGTSVLQRLNPYPLPGKN